jgi:hypothetical protein
MMPRACWQMRRQLSAFHDGELPVGDQIAVQAHLRECPECAAEARELDDLGACLRAGALSVGAEPCEFEGLPSTVVSRMKAEEAESISGRTGRFFEDLHVVWAALGATGATVACLLLIATILHFAIPLPAGSNENPQVVNLQFSPDWTGNYGMSFPSPSGDAFSPSSMPDEPDLVMALDTVVTREGRVRSIKVIQEPGRGIQKPSAEVIALLDAISKSRFQPARLAGGRVPVAVNMVWLYASLTVKGKMPEVQVMPRPKGSTSNSFSIGPRISALVV